VVYVGGSVSDDVARLLLLLVGDGEKKRPICAPMKFDEQK
jgi:hypothetical protein